MSEKEKKEVARISEREYEDERKSEREFEAAMDEFQALSYELSAKEDVKASEALRKLVSKGSRDFPRLVRFVKEQPSSKARTTVVLILAGRVWPLSAQRAIYTSIRQKKDLPEWFHLLAQERIDHIDEKPPLDEPMRDWAKRHLQAYLVSNELERCRKLDRFLQNDSDLQSYIIHRFGYAPESCEYVSGYYGGMCQFYVELADFPSALRMCDEIDKLPWTDRAKPFVREAREDTTIKGMLHEAELLLDSDREKAVALFKRAWDRYHDVFPEVQRSPSGGCRMDRALNRLYDLQRAGKVPEFEKKK